MHTDSTIQAARIVLTGQIEQRRNEVLRLRSLIQKIHKLEEQIVMLEGSLALIQGDDSPGDSHESQPQPAMPVSNGSSPLSEFVYAILKDTGRALGAGEIVTRGAIHGKIINYHSLTGLMSGKIRQGKQFYRQGNGKNGKYGLLEWKTE